MVVRYSSLFALSFFLSGRGNRDVLSVGIQVSCSVWDNSAGWDGQLGWPRSYFPPLKVAGNLSYISKSNQANPRRTSSQHCHSKPWRTFFFFDFLETLNLLQPAHPYKFSRLPYRASNHILATFDKGHPCDQALECKSSTEYHFAGKQSI